MLIANIFGLTIYLFLMWKTLKDDYLYEKIFNLSFGILFSVVLGYAILNFVPVDYWFWVILIVSASTLVFLTARLRMKSFETLEAYSISFLPWLSLYFMNNAILYSKLTSFIAFWFVLFCIFLYFFLKSHYRSYSWYKSGRVGFSGVAVLLFLFLTRFISSFFNIDIISYAPKYEIFLNGSSSLLLVLLMYNLFKEEK